MISRNCANARKRRGREFQNLLAPGVYGLITMAGKESQHLDAQPPSADANSVAALGEKGAAIIRELNQPLTTIALDAEACLQWLAHQNPNIPEAIRSIRHILRDVQRASRLAKQIRSLVANSSN